ncbi:hypothetical protein NHX12_032131 [Muraenolepis orangiensis]|uniref:Uncharacterized protein n=1 Tax=Muraenolepis orangiensis TaxID=630683 RepID=A0A9Q0E8T0_9TELE|nr:hypothetical protein NHX12_032131 [Muraenolepis orangiensis]
MKGSVVCGPRGCIVPVRRWKCSGDNPRGFGPKSPARRGGSGDQGGEGATLRQSPGPPPTHLTGPVAAQRRGGAWAPAYSSTRGLSTAGSIEGPWVT